MPLPRAPLPMSRRLHLTAASFGTPQVQLFRKKLRVHLKGDDVPDPIFAFADLAGSLPAKVLEGMVTAKWTNPTPIQHQAIPIMLRKRHLLAIAPTGSGKTLAFAIPIIATLGKPMAEGFRAVVISPTRELAQQVRSCCFAFPLSSTAPPPFNALLALPLTPHRTTALCHPLADISRDGPAGNTDQVSSGSP